MSDLERLAEGEAWALGACPEGVSPALWRDLAKVLGASPDPLAVFDADGTLWADDLGETHLRVLDEGGLVAASPGYDSLLVEYEARCAANVDDAYAWGARILAGMDEEVVRESAKETWARHKGLLLAPMVGIVRGLIDAGVDVAVVSASNRWIIEAAVADLGVGHDRVVAVDLEREGGALTNRVLQPMPNGAGKVGAIDALLGQRPVLAFGNSIHDVPMLAYADLGVFVLATHPGQPVLSESLEVIRVQHGWHYLAAAHPVK